MDFLLIFSLIRNVFIILIKKISFVLQKIKGKPGFESHCFPEFL